jgi:hypothetical protein
MTFGAVAQLGERRPCKAEVAGSIPVSSTKILARRRQRSILPYQGGSSGGVTLPAG